MEKNDTDIFQGVIRTLAEDNKLKDVKLLPLNEGFGTFRSCQFERTRIDSGAQVFVMRREQTNFYAVFSDTQCKSSDSPKACRFLNKTYTGNLKICERIFVAEKLFIHVKPWTCTCELSLFAWSGRHYAS